MRESITEVDTGQRKPYQLEHTSHLVELPGLPNELSGVTIAHLTDFHGGFGGTEPVYDRVVEIVNSEEPDYILLTGDYVDDSLKTVDYRIENVLCRLKARRGIFGALGNHDHRGGAAGARKGLENAGVHVLVNENVVDSSGLPIAGIDDLTDGEPDMERTLQGLPTDRPAILLSHNPTAIERVGDRPLLVLSGHTHGGQFNLAFPSPRLICLVHLRCRQVAGWYTNGKARGYVSRGIGVTGRPYRINCPAEVAIMRLVRAPD